MIHLRKTEAQSSPAVPPSRLFFSLFHVVNPLLKVPPSNQWSFVQTCIEPSVVHHSILFVYEGISYLNEDQQKMIQKSLDRREMFQGVERDVDEEAMQKLCSIVAEWIFGSSSNEPLEIKKDDELSYTKDYVIHYELRNRFPDIWTTINKNVITINRVDKEERQKLEEKEVMSKEEQAQLLQNELLGFTRVFKLIIDSKKPIMGHNMLMDLLLYFDKFHQPLPASYKEFKKELHALFPVIIDTKHISSLLRKPLEHTGLFGSTSLGELYKAFHSQKGQQYVIHTPSIELGPGCEEYKEQQFPHEAGYDAYMCGYVFLRLAHIETFKNVKSTDVVPCSFRRYLHTISEYANKVNIIRATISYLNIAGDDPVSQRPEILFVKSKMSSYRLEAGQIAQWFSPFGSVDIKLQGYYTALVATSNFGCAKDILRKFRKHEKIHVAKYSLWRHSPIVRNALIVGTLFSGGLCVWALWSGRKET